MKKLIFAAALASASLLLFSCGNRNRDPEEYVRTENFTVYETTAIAEDSTRAFNPEQDNTSKDVRFSYALNGNTVELIINDREVSSLDFYYTPDEKYISVDDFNFDGYNDIFIPNENAELGYGSYYCYIPENKDFKENDELNEIGRIMKKTADNTLIDNQNDGYTDRYIEYQWSGGKLKAFRKTEIYTDYSDGKVHTDVYMFNAKGMEYLAESSVADAPTEETTEADTTAAASETETTAVPQ